MKVLICGSRNWSARNPIERELRKLPAGSIIVHGAARGPDTIADELSGKLGFEVRRYPADWKVGRAAGPIRNSQMLEKEHRTDEPLDMVMAFTEDLENSKGTKDMVTKAKRGGVKRVVRFAD
jgi:YspA, cpYpsA-related SLOG family